MRSSAKGSNEIYPHFHIIEPLSADGSSRTIYRGLWKGRPALLFLPSIGPMGLEEARSFWIIGQHLFHLGLWVPEPLWHDSRKGVVVVEEKSGKLLQEWFHGNEDAKAREAVIETILDKLITMACEGPRRFWASWCWDWPVYDSGLALNAEGRYFLHWVGRRLLELPADILAAAEQELRPICRRIDHLAQGFFIHRDMQSRNIIIDYGCRSWFIDYQGARLGPFGYDAVSLIHDSYLDLPWPLRMRLTEGVAREARREGLFSSVEEGMGQLLLLALLRTFQACGAFAKLGAFRGRPWFLPYLPKGLETLAHLLAISRLCLPRLREVVEMAMERVPSKDGSPWRAKEEATP